nr:MAG TPA: hypothetical protein [Caudoviricetes sp.]
MYYVINSVSTAVREDSSAFLLLSNIQKTSPTRSFHSESCQGDNEESAVG